MGHAGIKRTIFYSHHHYNNNNNITAKWEQTHLYSSWSHITVKPFSIKSLVGCAAACVCAWQIWRATWRIKPYYYSIENFSEYVMWNASGNKFISLARAWFAVRSWYRHYSVRRTSPLACLSPINVYIMNIWIQWRLPFRVAFRPFQFRY